MKTVFINGSPKKSGSVSAYILGIVRLLVKGEVVKERVRTPGDYKRVLEQIRDADAVVFGLPLYVDGVPSHLLPFMKEMEAFCKENDIHVRVYVASNSGFIEGSQNRALMQVFENFCKRGSLPWCGGIGIGGGVMLNVMKILAFVYTGLFAVGIVMEGLPTAALAYAEQMGMALFFSIAPFIYCLRMGSAINKGKNCGVKFTRVLIPSFLFILVADIFFVIISLFQGGLFRGWLRRK